MLLARFSSSVGCVGVDISDGVTRLLQVREQGGELHVVGAGVIDLPASPDGEVNRPAFIDMLRAAIVSGGFTGRKCVVCLPRQFAQVQAVRLPRMPDAELAQAAHWEAAQRCGKERDQLSVDFLRTGLPTKPGENREELLIVAIANSVINLFLEPMFEAGMRPSALETDFSALARFHSRLYRREADREVVRVLLDLSRTGSTVIILRGNQVVFCKPINIGGKHFDKAVSEHLQLDEVSAAGLRASRVLSTPHGTEPAARGAANDPATERAIFEAVRPLMGELIKEVSLCLRYYGVSFRGKPPERLVLTGHEAMEPRLAETLAETCKLPVDVDDQTGTMARLISQIQSTLNREPGPKTAWVTAAGLSMRGMVRTRAARRSSDPAPVAATQEAA